jgi:hypothetical protein
MPRNLRDMRETSKELRVNFSDTKEHTIPIDIRQTINPVFYQK